jgi:hypothetical protein
MCYKCELCGNVVPHNTPMRKKVIYNGKAIQREIPICEKCDPEARTLTIQLPVMASTHGRNGGSKGKRIIVPQKLCDICSKPIGDEGQQTAESTLCKDHLPKRKGRK